MQDMSSSKSDDGKSSSNDPPDLDRPVTDGPPPVYPDSYTPHPDSTELCQLAGPGHFHYETAESPELDGQLGSDSLVIYRHWLDTHCHGFVQWTWSVDLDDPGVPSCHIAATGPFTGCDYCVTIVAHANEAAGVRAFEQWRLMVFTMSGFGLELLSPHVKGRKAKRESKRVRALIREWLDGDVSE